MSIIDDLHRQEHDKKRFEELRQNAWTEMKERHASYAHAFGGDKQLPKEYQDRIANENRQFQTQWSSGHGTYHQTMTEQHEEQMERHFPQPAPTPANQSQTAMQETQDKMKELIAQQKRKHRPTQEQQQAQQELSKAQKAKPKQAQPQQAKKAEPSREQRKQELIAQQKAMTQRAQEHKRKR